MMGSFFLGLYIAASVPTVLLFSPVIHLSIGITWFCAFIAYTFLSVIVIDDAQTSENFFREWGINELGVGFITGLFFSYELLALNYIAPGSLIVGIAVTIASILGIVAYVSISVIFESTESLARINGYARGISASLLSIVIGVSVLQFFAFATGVPVFAFGVEIALFASFALMMCGNIYTVFANGSIEVSKSYGGLFDPGTDMHENRSPSYGALILFVNSVDMLATAVRVITEYNSPRDSKVNWVGISEVILGTAIFYVGIKFVAAMVSGGLKTNYDHMSAVPPAYDAFSVSPDTPQYGDNGPPRYVF